MLVISRADRLTQCLYIHNVLQMCVLLHELHVYVAIVVCAFGGPHRMVNISFFISFVQFGSTVSVALDPIVIIPCAPTHTHELLRIFVPSHT